MRPAAFGMSAFRSRAFLKANQYKYVFCSLANSASVRSFADFFVGHAKVADDQTTASLLIGFNPLADHSPCFLFVINAFVWLKEIVASLFPQGLDDSRCGIFLLGVNNPLF